MKDGPRTPERTEVGAERKHAQTRSSFTAPLLPIGIPSKTKIKIRESEEINGPENGQDRYSDLALVLQAKKNDRHAFDVLIERYGKSLLGMIRTIIREEATAEDLWQETFFRAIRNIGNYNPQTGEKGTGFRSWLYRIAINLTLDELRRRKRWRTLSWASTDNDSRKQNDAPETNEPMDPRPDPGEILDGKHRIQSLREAMTRIPNRYRVILILRDYQELSYQEISDVLDLPIGTVRSRLSRARNRLRKALEKRDG